MQACLTCLAPNHLFLSPRFTHFLPTDFAQNLRVDSSERAYMSKLSLFCSTVSQFRATAQRKTCPLSAKMPFISAVWRHPLRFALHQNTSFYVTNRRRAPPSVCPHYWGASQRCTFISFYRVALFALTRSLPQNHAHCHKITSFHSPACLLALHALFVGVLTLLRSASYLCNIIIRCHSQFGLQFSAIDL